MEKTLWIQSLSLLSMPYKEKGKDRQGGFCRDIASFGGLLPLFFRPNDLGMRHLFARMDTIMVDVANEGGQFFRDVFAIFGFFKKSQRFLIILLRFGPIIEEGIGSHLPRRRKRPGGVGLIEEVEFGLALSEV